MGSPSITICHGLPPVDLADASLLLSRCNLNEGLDLALNLAVEGAPDAQEVSQLLYREDGQLVGLLTIDGSREIEVSLGVDPAHRRRGIGRRLLDAARLQCSNRGQKSWILVVDEAAASGRAFVRAVGGSYQSSEYRLELARDRVPAPREWDRPAQLRQAGPGDAELLSRLVAESSGDPLDEVMTRVSRDLAKPNHRFDIATLDGMPIGQIRTNFYGDVIYITAFGVVPEYRARGFGRQILEATVRRLIAEDWPHIRIEVATNNANALGLYQSSGFNVKTEYGYYHQEI
ncbi:MAG TPA: GNAT family N-acetyltransferase [Chloroflexota bacterium]|nr:GNAT family N-acetyltransferase [Chloroflexota bacterium]